MTEPSFDIATAHRWFAVEFNNQAWDLLESPDRTAEQTGRMIHLAHAACAHWLAAGTAVHHQRALVLVARAHAEAGNGQPALTYARLSLELAEQHADELADFDWAFTYECLARAHAAAGESAEAQRFKLQARQAGEKIGESEDKNIFESGFSKGNWYGVA